MLDSEDNEGQAVVVRPFVRALTTPEGATAVREALTWIADERPALFARLFGGGATRPSVQGRSGSDEATPIWVSEALFNYGLLAKRGRVVVGTVPIRRFGARFYLQALGLPDGMEYRHEAWPETDALLAALPSLLAAQPRSPSPSPALAPASASAPAPAPASPPRLLDVGTGCGIVAIEARCAGFAVVATDVDPACLMLADWNARLAGIADLDLRHGPGFAPVEGETFDAVVCNPDYGGVRDALRIEILHRGVDRLRDGGTLFVATMLEWQDQLPFEVPLSELVVRGFAVTVEPIVSTNRADWFARVGPDSVPGVPSRHRFTIRVTRAERPQLRVKLPPDTGAARTRQVVPLAMVKRVDQVAAITTVDDCRALVELIGRLAVPEVVLDGPLPEELLDECRFGAQPCVGPRGAAGALVQGISVRPCAHGEAVGRTSMTMAELDARYAELDRELQVRRGCPSCSVYLGCSRCLHPGPLDERAYCELMRSLGRSAGLVFRLLETRRFLIDEGVAEGALRILRGPLPEPVVGKGAEPDSAAGDEPLGALVEVARRWRRCAAWAVERSGHGYLQVVRGSRLQHYALSAMELDLLSSLAHGGGIAALAALVRAHPGPPGHVALAVTRLMDRLGA